MKKSQVRCIVGNSLVMLAAALTLCFFALNLIEGIGKNDIYAGITHLAGATGNDVILYIVANAFFILTLILSIVMFILGTLGLMGGIFDIKGLNMTIANRALSILNMLSALIALACMIAFVAVVGVRGSSVGAGPITVFLTSILAVVGAFVAQSRKIYRI